MIALTADLAPAAFEAIAKQVNDDPVELLDSLVPILQNNEKNIFLTEVDPDGRAWKDLSLKTVNRKGFSKILVETGRLYQSLTAPAGTSDTIWQTETSPSILTFGTSVPYARLQQFGGFSFIETEKGKKRIEVPARPFVGVKMVFEDRLVNAVADAAVKRIVKEK